MYVNHDFTELSIWHQHLVLQQKKSRIMTKRFQWVFPVLLFVVGIRCQVKVNQSLLEFAREGETSSIACRYESSSFYSLQWYRQFPGEGPTHLLTITGKVPRKEHNFSADLNKEEKLSRLNITGVQHGDKATYFCAVEAQ
ncbi:UNVERIFIED_CONTAM: hypothetical protein K2H54_044969 [Gekko kuhli]